MLPRTKIIAIIAASLIGVGGIMYAGYELAFKKSVTYSNSDITSAPLATSTDPDIAQTSVYGTQKLALDSSVYLRDDGQQSVFLPSSKKPLEAQDEGKAILAWLENPQPNSDTKQQLIKQATLGTPGDTFVFRGGAKLKDHIILGHAVATVSGDDLLISADPRSTTASPVAQTDNGYGYQNRGPAGSSYVIITKANEINYLIQNNDNRFSEGIYMIAKNSNTIFNITWNDDLGSPRMMYVHDKDSYDMYINYDTITAPQKTELRFQPQYLAALTQPTVYHVSFATSGTNTNQQLIDDATKATNAGMAKRLPSGITSYTKLTANASGEYLFTTTSSDKQAIIVMSKAHMHTITINTNVPFTPTISDASNEYQPYVMRIDTPYDIVSDDVNDSLQKILGTGAYEMQGGKAFTYKIQPKQTYAGTVNVKNIFGQTATMPLSLHIDSIDPRVVTKQVLANDTISILPSDGSFQDVLIQHENIGNFPVTFQACSFKKTLGAGTAGGLENQLFDCEGKTYTQQVTTKDFRYWKAYRTAITLPKDFPTNSAFKVTIPNSANAAMGQGDSTHMFMKSSLGIWAKINNKKVSLRGFHLADNSAVSSGTFTATSLSGKPVATVAATAGPVSFALPTDKDKNILMDPLLVTLTDGDTTAFIVVHPQGQSDRYKQSANNNGQSYHINSFVNPSDVVSSNTNINFWGDTQTTKIYGYSDRGLYKAGETIYFAGFVRNLTQFGSLDYLKGGTVAVHIADVQGNAIYDAPALPLDEFGGFKGSAPIPTALKLGDAIVSYTYSKDPRAAYSHNIKINEYQKPTFFTDITYENHDNDVNLVLKPQYYFGQPVNGYDASVTWSLAGKDTCAYCRRWNQDTYYYNFVFNDTISTGSTFKVYKQGTSTSQKLFASDILQQKGYQYTLKAEVTVRDNKSDEVQFFTKYIDFQPDVKIGLEGQPYTWLYDNGGKKPYADSIDGEIAGGKDKIHDMHYEVYYRSYDDQQTEVGVDGNAYYLNGMNYKKISEGNIDVSKNFSVKTSFITKAGSYLLRVYARDKNNTVIGEVQKQLEYYKASDDSDGLLGALPNNYALTVSIPKKTYEEGDNIPVDIAPYQKGAHVIMTVERGDQIVDTIEKDLDGSQLSLTVKKGYAPNIVVNVMQVAGTDKSRGTRKEPRFYVGYGQADISTAMHTLNVAVTTDKTTYKPGDKVTMTIKTTDSKGNPVDARLSIGVIDQALISMYDLVKEPLPYFFNKVGTSVFNYTNMKLLYQSLKAFANNGSKGGGGNGGQAMFSMIRDDLEDTAFWRGGVITTGGKAELSFTVPDNLTTWVIDVIGITKDTRLGTTRKTFITTKDLVIEPNPPLFMTLGDTIDIPVKAIVTADALRKGDKISGTASITNARGETIDLGGFTADANSKVTIPVTIPGSWSTSTYVILKVTGTYNGATDGTTRVIPLRSEGLTVHDSAGVINTAGDHTFVIPENFGSTLTMQLSTLPSNLIDPIITNAIFYPYGCTEQLLSNATAIKTAYDLRATKRFTSALLQDDTIITPEGPQNISANINNTIAQILARQQSNGSFGRWNNGDTQPNSATYALSTYVYSALLSLKSMATNPTQLDNALERVEAHLWDYRTLSQTAFLRYLSEKSAAGRPLTAGEKTELTTINPLKVPYGGLLRYTIAVYQKDENNAAKWKQFATIPTNQDWNETSVFINQVSAYAIQARAVFTDTKSTQDERMKALQNVIGSRTSQGDRGTTIGNIQVLKAITAINSTNRPTKEKVTCTATIDGKAQSVTVLRDQINTITQPSTQSKLAVSWSCDSPLIADISVSYMPKTLHDLLGAAQHVTQMNYSIANPKVAIGEMTSMIGSWTTTMAGEQVAVSIYLPATYKLVDSIISKNIPTAGQPEMPRMTNILPFDMSDSRCMPSHWETKYDRLFLYYDTLPAITCDISIPVLKAYNGNATIMPMSVAEMYKGTINGRKVILNK